MLARWRDLVVPPQVRSLAESRPQVCGLSAALLGAMETGQYPLRFSYLLNFKQKGFLKICLHTDSDEDVSEKSAGEDYPEELTDVHFKFEVREVGTAVM